MIDDGGGLRRFRFYFLSLSLPLSLFLFLSLSLSGRWVGVNQMDEGCNKGGEEGEANISFFLKYILGI